MCSIGEDDFGDDGGVHTMLENLKEEEINGEICKKCSLQESIIKLDFKDSMCKSCFLYYVRHKFRAALGSSKLVKRNSNVLIKFSGSLADICMLHMLKFAFEEEVFKRLYLNLSIMYVDETCLLDGQKRNDADDRMQGLTRIRGLLQQFEGFKCYYSSIADNKSFISDIQSVSNTDIENVIKLETVFSSSFDSLKTLTSKQDFLEVARKNCLRNHANQLNCPYVFLPDISIDLAKTLISNICLGRGSSVAKDVSFCDDSDSCVKFIRPLKDLTSKEVENYGKLNNLKFLSKEYFGFALGQFASIQNLSSQFIDRLQGNYSSTVSTVYKCSNKLTSKFSRETDKCALCKASINCQTSETLTAVEFSRSVSKIASEAEKLENIMNLQKVSMNSRISNCAANICHGCRKIFFEMDDKKLFNEL